MIVVHHLNNSRSQRVLWLLEELGLHYELRRYQRDARTMLAPPELRRVHPLGKSPVVTLVDSRCGEIVLAESGWILEYLVERFGIGRLAPPLDTPERLSYRHWMHYAEGSAMPPLLLKLIFDRIEQGPMPFFVKPIAKAISSKVKSSFIEPNLTAHLDYLEAALSKSRWFAGEAFTAADIQLSFPIEAAAARAGFGPSRPKLADFLKRIHARPAYQRAIERGGPFALA